MNEVTSKPSTQAASNSQESTKTGCNDRTSALPPPTLNTLNQIKNNKLRDQHSEIGALKHKILELSNENRMFKLKLIRNERELKMAYKNKLELMEKNHKTEIKELQRQLKAIGLRCEEYKIQNGKTEEILREKERLIEIRNVNNNQNKEQAKKSYSFPKPQPMSSGYGRIRRFQKCADISAKDDSCIKKLEDNTPGNNAQAPEELNTIKIAKEHFSIDIRQLIHEEIHQIINEKESVPKPVSQTVDKYIESPMIAIDEENPIQPKTTKILEPINELKGKSLLELEPLIDLPKIRIDYQYRPLVKQTAPNDKKQLNLIDWSILNSNFGPPIKPKPKACKSPCVLNNSDALAYPPERFYHFPQIIKQDLRENRQHMHRYKMRLEDKNRLQACHFPVKKASGSKK